MQVLGELWACGEAVYRQGLAQYQTCVGCSLKVDHYYACIWQFNLIEFNRNLLCAKHCLRPWRSRGEQSLFLRSLCFAGGKETVNQEVFGSDKYHNAKEQGDGLETEGARDWQPGCGCNILAEAWVIYTLLSFLCAAFFHHTLFMEIDTWKCLLEVNLHIIYYVINLKQITVTAVYKY